MSSQVVSSVSTPEPTAKKGPTVAVFCGSSSGKSPVHVEAARALAHALHERGIRLVYGGGHGLMSAVATTLVKLSGPQAVHGVVPEALLIHEHGSKKIPDPEIYGQTTVVADMHTRKQLMAREVIEGGPGSGFVALSGGFGTMDELMEIVTWNQLSIHDRAIVVFNVEGYYDGLLQWIDKAVESGFIGSNFKDIMVEATTAQAAVDALRDYVVVDGRYKLPWGKQ